jgi:S-adenosylmethionine:tRNA ribosyltransferase-isomerase
LNYSIDDYNYELPVELIAQEPALKRDWSRLLYLQRPTGKIEEYRFSEMPSLLRSGDLLVVNNAKVFPAKLFGKKETGGRVEILVLEHSPRPADKDSNKRWCLVRASKRPRQGTLIVFPDGLTGTVGREGADGAIEIQFNGGHDIDYILKKRGCLPLPPYIKRDAHDRRSEMDRKRYQTIFSHFSGAIAAPTAGLHFTDGVISTLKSLGIDLVSITLFVGHGTFKPVRVNDIREHTLGGESYFIENDAACSIERARQEGRRIVAVGTTVVRTLETVFKEKGRIVPGSGVANLFIYPGFTFQVVDSLLTNFHLPRSSLLFLVSAFAGRDLIMEAYNLAVEKRYRFYSYGDAMLIT